VGQAGGILLLAALFTPAAVHAQLKNTQYAQMPPMAIEPIIVKASGVYPAKIVRPQGPFLLYIENRLTGHAAHFSLALNQTNASEFFGLDTNALAPRTSNMLDLMPGTYLLTIQNQGLSQNIKSPQQAGWTVTIQITN
jgi:hypothetical protein